MKNKLDKLEKADSISSPKPSKKSNIAHSKIKIAGIISSLGKPTAKYQPGKTIESIQSYIDAGNNRILYSELTSSVYSMSDELIGITQTNLDNLLKYAYNKDNQVTEEIYNFVVRLWDHFNLAINQVDNAEKILATSAEKTKEALYDQLSERFKAIEKEYIAILGIFASIVITFTAGITFSSSVLQNIASASIYRTLIVSLVIGLVLVNILFGLFYYINKLTNKDAHYRPLIISNVILLALIGLVLAGWYCGTVEKRNEKIASQSVEYDVIDNAEEVTPPAEQIAQP